MARACNSLLELCRWFGYAVLPQAYKGSLADWPKLATACLSCVGALDEVDWLRNKLERLETSISAMARTAGSGGGEEGGSNGGGPQAPPQPGQQAKEYRYDK